jgi:hypothetical protein
VMDNGFLFGSLPRYVPKVPDQEFEISSCFTVEKNKELPSPR